MARSSKRTVLAILLALVAVELAVRVGVYIARDRGPDASPIVAVEHDAKPEATGADEPTHPALSEDHDDRADRSPAALVALGGDSIGPAESSGASSRGGDFTVLHVRVVAKDGSPITRGHIDCEWKGRRTSNTATGRVGTDIADVVTDVRLPIVAETCSVTASTPGRPPSRIELAGFRRKALESAPIAGRVDRDVSVRLLDSIRGPTLSGSITVNGERRVPDGLDIIVDTVSGSALVNRVDATYVVPALPHGAPKAVRVESDDSWPQSFRDPTPDASGNWKLDLALVSKRSLRVSALDASTHGPAQGVDLVCKTVVEGWSEGTRVRRRGEEEGTRRVRKTTDASGVCMFRGLPDGATLSVREARELDEHLPALFSMSVTATTPDEVRASVQVNAPRAIVWGTLPGELTVGAHGSHSYDVRRARSNKPGHLGGTIAVALATDGRWSFECEVPSAWVVWIGEKAPILTQVQRIVVDRAQEYGPIQLAMATTTSLRVIVRNPPPSGGLDIAARDELGRNVYSKPLLTMTDQSASRSAGGEIVDTFPVQGTVIVTINAFPGGGSHCTRSITVDPRVTSEVVIDMGDLREREIEFQLNGAAPGGGTFTTLELRRLDNAGAEMDETAYASLADGAGRAALPIAGGTYFYSLSDVAGCVLGMVRIASESESRVVKIEWRGHALRREDLGAGIELETLDGVSCANLSPERRQVRWPAWWKDEVFKNLLVPDGCKYRVLE
jgi:hypothetical protein